MIIFHTRKKGSASPASFAPYGLFKWADAHKEKGRLVLRPSLPHIKIESSNEQGNNLISF